MSDDYISRDAVFDWFCESADIDGCVDLPKNNGYCKKGCRHCIGGEELDEIPTADVRKNVHAHWDTVEMKKGEWWHTCSKCKAAWGSEDGELDFNFCPNCGARMDERREE